MRRGDNGTHHVRETVQLPLSGRPSGFGRPVRRGRAPEEVIRLFLADLGAAHGSVRGYVTGRLGITDATVGALRDRLLDG
ncbi:tyrosine-protein phosphatase [[Kitasatospora] papulosa]|uniref:tyrosine-protein phosphatase n=1 Tax=[Kitasatospora] papulosa TaxID=1464011 RepID=UPI003685E52E